MSGWPDGVGRLILEETDSTNAEAMRRAEAASRAPIWIMARRQTAGRGRRGRAWASPAGNLAATLLTPHDGPARAAAALFAPVAGLAAADLCAAFLPAGRVALKWPNDVLAGGAKVAGILIESAGGTGGRALRVAVGVGVNLAHAPPPDESRHPATSVAAETGTAPDPEAALARLASRFAHWHALGRRDHGALIDAWRGRMAGIGRPIEARLGARTVSGRFEAVDAEGRLVLRTPAGLERIAAGDVFFAE